MQYRRKGGLAAAVVAVAALAALLAVGLPVRADFVLTVSDGKGDSITADQTTGTYTTTGTVTGVGGGSPVVTFAPE